MKIQQTEADLIKPNSSSFVSRDGFRLGIRVIPSRPYPIHGFKNGFHHRGFALVASLMMMILLTILVMGMLSLSAVTVRSNRGDTAMEQARANARMALMIAIGELQKHAGPDQRITANAAILSDPDDLSSPDVVNPYWTGVWDSWKAGDTSPSGGDEPSHHATLGTAGTGLSPKYSKNKQDHFRKWLVSIPDDQQLDIESARSIQLAPARAPGSSQTSVTLVGTGSLGESSDANHHVAVKLIDVISSSGDVAGRYGWWVGDQSVKASIMSDSHDGGALTTADRLFRHQAPGSTGSTRAVGLENVNQSEFVKAASLKTLDLIEDASDPATRGFHDITTASLGVIADVREGGLKRDLNTLLDRQINVSDTSDEYMLYKFSTGAEERVPIQDLSAYYQLYQDDPTGAMGRKGGVKFGSSGFPNAIQVESPDFGSPNDRDKTLREYTTLYRNPVPIRIQYIFAVTAVPFDPSILTPQSQTSYDSRLTHLLIPGVMPVITLWNPNSVPLVMGGSAGRSQVFYMGCPPVNFAWSVRRADGFVQEDAPLNFNYLMSGQSSSNGQANSDSDCSRILSMRFGKDNQVVFEPGEVKVFTIPDTTNIRNLLTESQFGGNAFGRFLHEADNSYNPYGFYSCLRGSAAGAANNRSSHLRINGRPFAYDLNFTGTRPLYVAIGPGDAVSCIINPENLGKQGANTAMANEVGGGGFQFAMIDNDNFSPITNSGTPGSTLSDHIRHYQFLSRFGGDLRISNTNNNINFNANMIKYGLTNAQGAGDPISFETLKNAAENGEVVTIAMFTLRAGCEAHSSAVGGYAGGRSTSSTRPFLHAGTIAPPFIDDLGPENFYNYGWDWAVERINSVEEAIQVDPGTGRNFYGGGYTTEAGTTHVVQQEIPVLPPISIAALSHAHLGGFSLASRPYAGEADQYFQSFRWLVGVFMGSYPENRDPAQTGDSYRRTTATGMGGMYPTVMQAVGNSYAHPGLAPDEAYKLIQRTYDNDVGGEDRIFADHSYLANKALWDEFFFSSIIPKPSSTPLYGGNLTAEQVAEQFFFDGIPLPNRRMVPHTVGLDRDELENLFNQKDDFTNGLADKIAGHLMVNGAFNINSTSPAAWKILLSSLRGKPVQYLRNNGASPTEVTPSGTPVAFGNLPNGEPFGADALENPNNPQPWKGWRELSDEEIDQLANAIVKQVKRRGPFLSLSEFINRRLDGDNRDLSLKGALQAALDDPNVSINEAFRAPDRILDNEPNIQASNFAFAEAARGPIAYGSSPYVDQADVLRHIGSQLTPRGDTFIIRTYGDALDRNGKVAARAWCEATVQRTPDYVEPSEQSELKQSQLQSEVNRQFGRKFEIVTFRWLNDDEI